MLDRPAIFDPSGQIPDYPDFQFDIVAASLPHGSSLNLATSGQLARAGRKRRDIAAIAGLNRPVYYCVRSSLEPGLEVPSGGSPA